MHGFNIVLTPKSNVTSTAKEEPALVILAV
jgi:hypothetical protein